jgi:Zinc carboxypeptidase
MIRKTTALTLFCLNLFVLGFSQKLLSPDEFMPHKYGEQFTPHNLTVDYFRHVAANSNLVQLKEYGKTNQTRPLLYAVVSTPENLANLEKIRLNNLARAGLSEGKADPSVKDITVVWLSMNVHGNEPASSESSVSVIYNLVNPTRADSKEWLKNTVVIIDPCVNPDGYHRYTHWYINASDKTPNTAADAREHREPWPGGRVNHYYFDLNRDWAWATQIETQQRLKIYKEWLPQVVPDFHEMGYNAPYYFAPAAQPYHRYITPFQRDFQVEIGKNHAKYFDKEGWLYFTREVFDLLYPSYGDTYPTYNGAIGMTYEQGGIGAGRAIQMENGNVLTLKDRIAHHLTTALSTIEISSKNANRLIQNFEEFYKKTSTNPQGAFKTYIVKAANPRNKIKAFCELLDRHKIKYGRITGSKQTMGYDYKTGKENTPLSISEGDVVISAYQPFSVLTQVLLDPEPELVDSATYDITAWSLPYAFGLETFASKERIDPTQSIDAKGFPLQQRPDSKPYAYVASWTGLNNARFAATLLQRGYKIRTASVPFEIDGKRFDRGALVINRGDNPSVSSDRFDREITSVALTHDQELNSVTTGFSSTGADLGSGRFDLLTAPKVAIIYDDDVDNNSYGQMWHYFEQDLNISVTQIKLSDLDRTRLTAYNVICMTDGGYKNLDSGKIDRFKQWATEGGRLILIGEACGAFEDKKGFEISKFANKKERETADNQSDTDMMKRRFMHFDEYERDGISDGTPGAIYKLTLDNTHPLGYGMPEYFFTLKTGNAAYQPLKNCWNVGIVDDKFKPLGFVGTRAKQAFKSSVSFAVQPMRRGSVVYLIDNPLYRSFWVQGKFLFSNAVLMPIR